MTSPVPYFLLGVTFVFLFFYSFEIPVHLSLISSLSNLNRNLIIYSTPIILLATAVNFFRIAKRIRTAEEKEDQLDSVFGKNKND